MKSQDETRKLIENLECQASQGMHDRIISGIRTTCAQQPVQYKPVRKWACVAAAAIVLVLVSIALQTPKRHSAPGMNLTLAPTNILSMRSMQLAFHNDGLDGLEEHLDASLTQVGPRPTEMLMQGLYENVDL